MTQDQQDEFNYRYWERLGNLCPVGEPTQAQRDLARAEAMQAIRILNGDEPDPLLK